MNYERADSMSSFIPLSVPNLKGNEIKYVTDAIEQEWVSTGGRYISQFEENFAEYARTDMAVACQSGTAAMHLALIECGVGAGDLVIVPTLTFVASVNPICYVGAEPVFMDCDDTLCLDMDKLEQYLTQECECRNGVRYDKFLNKPVRAVIVVHMFGDGADMDRLTELAESHNFLVIEDAAEAVGSFYATGRYKDRMAGTIGDFGIYSFNGNKIITTGGGGMVVGRDLQKLEHIKFLSTQAKADELYYIHDEIGYNYRMTNIQAALGVAQLEQLEAFIEVKKENYHHYIRCGIPLFPFSGRVRPNYWFYTYRSADRDRLISSLGAMHMQSRPIWKLNHLQSMFTGFRAYKIDKANRYYENTVNLPCSTNLRSEEVERVSAAVKSIDAELFPS